MKLSILLCGALLLFTANLLHSQQESAPLSLHMAQVSLLVKDQDEALKYYTSVFGFIKKEDAQFGKERWLTIAAPAQQGMALVLVKAITPTDFSIVGKQAGDRTLMVLETTDFDNTYQKYQDMGVDFVTQPVKMDWGRQVQFNDLYGNRLVLLEVKKAVK